MLRYLPMIIVLGFTLYCFIDVLVTDRRRFRSLGKPLWLLVALLPVVGAILWLVLGRPRHKAKPASEGTVHLRRPPRPIAPDDDPEFLRKLDEQAWRAKRDAERARGEENEGKGEGPADPQPA